MRTRFDEEWFARLLAAHASGPDLRIAEAVAAVAERHDWGEAPDTTGFVGRDEELALLRRSVLDERCRLVAVLGFGGVGKTALAARLAQCMAPSFDRVHWRTLHSPRPVSDWLAGAIASLSGQQLTPPASESDQLTALLRLLRTTRCFLVLDNFDSLLQPGQPHGSYRAGMEGYSGLLQAVGEAAHKSCLVLTSRETPPDLVLGGLVRELRLRGLGIADAQALLAEKQLRGDTEAWGSLVQRFGGNGLALKIVGETIRRVYYGDLATFLAATANSGAVFGGIRRLLDTQVRGLTPVEQDVLTRMAVEQTPIALRDLVREMSPNVGRSAVIDAIETLRSRSLVARGERSGTFTLPSMVLDYVAGWGEDKGALEID